MVAPLLVLAALWKRFDLGRRGRLRRRRLELGPLRMHTTSPISGALSILSGVVLLRYEAPPASLASSGSVTLPDLEHTAQRSATNRAAAIPAGSDRW